jgi:hypothetical protein
MRKMSILISFVIVFLFVFLTACNRNHKEWEDLTGKYYVTYLSVDGVVMDLDESQSYINLEIDENGNCYGSSRIALADGSYENVETIVNWWFDDEENIIVIAHDDEYQSNFEVIEYGNTIKLDFEGEIVIAEKQND